MSFKPKYTDFDSAPMAFYNFIKYAIWVGIVIGIIQVIGSIGMFTGQPLPDSLIIMGVIGIIIDIAVIVCEIIAAIGLKNMEWSGVKAYYLSFIISIVGAIILMCYGGFAFGIDLVLDPEILGQLIGNAVVFVLVKIYFDKRKLLFSPNSVNIDGDLYADFSPASIPDRITESEELGDVEETSDDIASN